MENFLIIFLMNMLIRLSNWSDIIWRIDSSVIANYYSNHYKGNKIAFTVQIGDKSFSEAPQAKKYADLLEINHKIIEVSDESVLNHWESGLSVLDEPNSDSAIITTAALMHVANKYVKCLYREMVATKFMVVQSPQIRISLGL